MSEENCSSEKKEAVNSSDVVELRLLEKDYLVVEGILEYMKHNVNSLSFASKVEGRAEFHFEMVKSIFKNLGKRAIPELAELEIRISNGGKTFALHDLETDKPCRIYCVPNSSAAVTGKAVDNSGSLAELVGAGQIPTTILIS